MDTDARLRAVDPLYPRDQVTFLLLDDAQDTYDDDRLWIDFLKEVYNDSNSYRVALFCSYGSTNSRECTKGTPPIIRAAARFSLRPTASTLGLLLNQAEFQDVVHRYDSICKRFDTSLCDQLYKWTDGHAGALCDLLYLICRVNLLI